MSYVPEQGDLVWIDFDPAKGHEIKKRRPAVIISSSQYNEATKYCIACPITSNQKRDNPAYYSLSGYETTGQVVTLQLRTLDYSNAGERNIQYIESLENDDFLQIYQRVQLTLRLDDWVSILKTILARADYDLNKIIGYAAKIISEWLNRGEKNYENHWLYKIQ